MAYDVNAMANRIRQAAARRGIDPDVAVRVAKSEGLGRGVWQSNVVKNGVHEPSYGPFQMLVGGRGTGFPTGMGNAFMRDTGLDPRDPANAHATVDYALDVASREGWRQWYGPKHVGIGQWDGVRGAKHPGTSSGGILANPNERLAGDGMVPRNTHAEVAAATYQPPVASIWGSGDQPSSGNVADPSVTAQSQALSDVEKRKKAWSGFFGALADYPDAQPARMGPMGDARQSGTGLLEYLANPNPLAQFARKQRGILG